MRHLTSILFIAAGTALAIPSWVQGQFHIQIAADPSEVRMLATKWSLPPAWRTKAVVRRVVLPDSGTMYRLAVPGYASRFDAETSSAELSAINLKHLIRADEEAQPGWIRAAVEGSDRRAAFPDAEIPVSMWRQAPLPIPVETDVRLRAIKTIDMSTSMVDVLDAIRSVDDGHPAKASAIVERIDCLLKAAPPGTPRPLFWNEMISEIKRVADGRVRVDGTSLTVARKRVAHILHYYERDRVGALRAYRQILTEVGHQGDPVTASDMRLQIAAAMFELLKDHGLSQIEFRDQLMVLIELSADEEQRLAVEPQSPAALAARKATSRMMLMLAESYLADSEWADAWLVDQNIVSTYAMYPDRYGEIGEAYCHLAHIACELGDYPSVVDATGRAIAAADALGKPIWGDKKRDVAFKAHLWRLHAARVLKQSTEEVRAAEDAVLQRFPNHASLKDWFK